MRVWGYERMTMGGYEGTRVWGHKIQGYKGIRTSGFMAIREKAISDMKVCVHPFSPGFQTTTMSRCQWHEWHMKIGHQSPYYSHRIIDSSVRWICLLESVSCIEHVRHQMLSRIKFENSRKPRASGTWKNGAAAQNNSWIEIHVCMWTASIVFWLWSLPTKGSTKLLCIHICYYICMCYHI